MTSASATQFLPAQAPDPGKFGKAIALRREHSGLQAGHIGERMVIDPAQEVRAAGHADVRREALRRTQRGMTHPRPALRTSGNSLANSIRMVVVTARENGNTF
jgi:hypothetical protein